ncbi:hypothetical protein P7C70_g3631, partial [Phenoliferia sp. Uapishka_3]
MDDSAPPRQLPEATSGSLDVPSPSDSAPPPQSQPISLPPRDYFASVVPNVAAAIPQTLRPNSTIPAFLRFLSLALFLGGTTAAAVAWVYKTIMLPRLVLALAARTKLHVSHLGMYDQLLGGIRGLGEGKGYRLIAPPSPPAVVVDPAAVETSGAPEPAVDKETAKSGQAGSLEEETVQDDSRPPPAIFTPLSTSLRGLTSAFASTPIQTIERPMFASPTTPVKPTDGLQSSLRSLSDYLAAETLASMSSAYRTHVPSATGPGKDQKKLMDAVVGLKAEIRMVKGRLFAGSRSQHAVLRA